MKNLIVGNDFTNRLILQGLFEDYGHANIAVNGKLSKLELIN